MSQILEIVMLVCFGLSWPMSVVKNIKAKTAKTMSLSFTLLIIGGYIAGITAKILSNQINFVLIAYLLNLAIVSMNVVVYFINRRYDKIAWYISTKMHEKYCIIWQISSIFEFFRLFRLTWISFQCIINTVLNNLLFTLVLLSPFFCSTHILFWFYFKAEF